MPRYDALLDKVLAAGVDAALKEDGFKRKRPRLYHRREEKRTVLIAFFRDTKWGRQDFDGVIGIFYDEFEALGRALTAYDDRIWFFESGAMEPQERIWASILQTYGFVNHGRSEGEHAYALSATDDRYRHELISRHPGDRWHWGVTAENFDEVVEDVIAAWRGIPQEWLRQMEDYLFVASWQADYSLRHNSLLNTGEMGSAGFYHLAGDHDRAQAQLQKTYDLGKITFREEEYSFRRRRLLWFGKGPSTPDSRRLARFELRGYRRDAKAARLMADYLGYRLD